MRDTVIPRAQHMHGGKGFRGFYTCLGSGDNSGKLLKFGSPQWQVEGWGNIITRLQPALLVECFWIGLMCMLTIVLVAFERLEYFSTIPVFMAFVIFIHSKLDYIDIGIILWMGASYVQIYLRNKSSRAEFGNWCNFRIHFSTPLNFDSLLCREICG